MSQQSAETAGDRAFQVDLRGLVDLLSHHLYSSPKVYLRELLQNGADALTARGDRGPDQRPGILLISADRSPDGRLHCLDSGVGLDPTEIGTFLATIGRSSKRDELGFARDDMLGQFGIGLLSGFLVSDEIEVVTRTTTGPIVRWVGRSDGSYRVDQPQLNPGDERARWLASGSGTCVSLAAYGDASGWLTSETITKLATQYAAFLPQRVVVRGGYGVVDVAPVTPPWRLPEPSQRREAMTAYAAESLRMQAFQVLPVSVPVAGLDGMAVIVDQPTSAGRPGGSRVFAKGMLLGDDIQGLLPDWAFFVRLVVDANGLRPTASREGLYDDELLAEVREQIGQQIRRWLLRTATAEPQKMARFLELHHIAIKALALTDDELLSIVLPLLTFETNQGRLSLPALAATTDVVRIARTNDEFRQVAAVAAAQGVAVVNGGYVYDTDLALRLPVAVPGARVEMLDMGDLDSHMGVVREERLRNVRPALDQVRGALNRLDVDVELRAYAPDTLPALYLDDANTRRRRESRDVAAAADDTWSAILGVLDDGGSARPRLFLNDANPTVRKVLALSDDELVRLAAEALYSRALLAGHHRLRAVDQAAMNQSFLGLLDRALGA